MMGEGGERFGCDACLRVEGAAEAGLRPARSVGAEEFAASAGPLAGEGRPCALTASVKRREAWAFLGHRGQAVDDELAARLEEAAALCERELAPRGMFHIFPVTATDAGVAVEGTGLVLPGESIARHLRGCDKVALLAVTLGPASEMVLRREAAISATGGMLVDACASSLVEQAAGVLNEAVDAAAARCGREATWRFSPGYGDLPLTVQGPFLEALDAGRALGITLTAANMLVPSKSITAIVGFRNPALREK
ncbi:vitamin B12 dependent methionine synthase [Adlercreutzia sp. R7]|uniref:Vitamin B12 dependent methionine synthase n=1 Tax=Adlercreutzia wanghongyangiae TaxID=3111451 RepID=A0ABU6IG52_9ACTN|nr:vitamin B12 dependent methionine synthase [Adlercreutzia sp. R7]